MPAVAAAAHAAGIYGFLLLAPAAEDAEEEGQRGGDGEGYAYYYCDDALGRDLIVDVVRGGRDEVWVGSGCCIAGLGRCG